MWPCGASNQAAEEFKKNIIAKHGVKNKSENLLGQKEEGVFAKLAVGTCEPIQKPKR